ncbi:S4 domain-containing protein [Aureisphaera galaxeae]|uniref:pseudouridine synthase n=1 Tax=Aureisphaera galaxeae TaxID=1538023 RepID=UPI0023502116|nr:S4 domain-containing protein [Aureisphaera galaxeae]MDC8002946.1 S4 domain-containing protein [Aureisphaera galaxeae]
MGRQDSGRKGNASGRGNNQRRRPNKPSPQKQKTSGSQKKGGAQPGIRLNKYIANSGICSRREADMYIETGQVTVNGKVVNEMGFRVMPSDEVKFDGRRISPEPPTFVLLNKPKGVATTTSESKGLTVMDIIAGAGTARIKPFGRLGRNATGLLLFTNDDIFRQKFSKKGIDRLFHIELDKNLKAEHLKQIAEGLKIDGKEIQVEEVSYVQNSPKKEVGLKIKHTGNSIIRTIFEHLGYDVVKVDCVTLGPLTKKDLPRGRYRFLTEEELSIFNRL